MRQRQTAGAVIIAILALAGCSVATDSAGGTSDLPGVAIPDSGSAESAADEPAASPEDRQVVSDGTIQITAEDPIAAAEEAVGIVEAAGGRIDSRNELPAIDDGNRTASADLVVRVPSAVLTATLDAIEALGEVELAQLAQTDVTATTRDLDARVTALRTSTDRLTALLAVSTSTEGLIDIERALSERQGELESLEAQQRAIGDQVRLATISIRFGSPDTAPVDTPDTFLSGLAAGADALIAAVGALSVAFGVALPWLAVLAVIAAVPLLVIRRRRSIRSATVTMEQ